MVKKIINIGIEGNDATGDPIRDAFEKTNENFNELYSFFGKGDGIRFTDLTDYDSNRNGELVPNSIFIVNNSGDPAVPGSNILAKTLEGDGIEIINTDPNKITIKNKGSRLVYDSAPALGAPLNSQEFPIYNLRDGIPADTTVGFPLTTFAVTQGYVGSNFLGLAGDTMRGPISVPAGATGFQVPRRNEVVGLSGDTMTGPLRLSRNPIPEDDIDYNGLIAATKNYVDTTSFSSQVNLFVSAASGNDFRFDVLEEKRGSALAYAFKTLNRACFKAEQLINAAAIELGPYQKPIFYDNGAGISKAVSVVGPKADNITYTLTITNGGGEVGTDMRGTSASSPATVDVRAGLLIRGTTSGALAMITTVDLGVGAGITIDGIVYAGTETYEVIFKNFKNNQPIQFIQGEPLEYSDSVKKLNITIFLESGEYYENYPIRVPPNVTLVGDDTRRVIIRPKTGPSGSVWSDLYFRRDITVDGLTVVTPTKAGRFVVGQTYRIKTPGTTVWANVGAGASSEGTVFIATAIGSGTGTAYCVFGYHYLTDPSKGLYNNPINVIDNSPSDTRYINAQTILNANRSFLQDEIIAYVDYQIDNSIAPYESFVLTADQKELCRRDIGSIIDAIGFDLVYGDWSRTLEVAMAYYSNASALIVITDQLATTVNMITRLETIVKSVIQKQLITKTTGNTSVQNTTFTITAEAGVGTVVSSLVRLLLDIINKDETVVNFPKNNDKLDLLLLNDSNRVRMLSAQGHGGFMCVLDPAGQILTKSPYVFQCSSFTSSINKQQFAGGLFVDAFTGNLSCKVLTNSYNSSTKITTLKVSGLVYRTPTNIPVSFVINGIRFEVDYIDRLNSYQTGEYNLYLNSATPDNVSYTGVSQVLTTNLVIELETAGNRSMLCSDYTQINDLGYGICASNGAFIEAVSIFTYYCYRGFYSLNGSQIRSLNGSCAFGTYALCSEGSDPTEVPTTADLRFPMIQLLTVYTAGEFSGKNLKSDLSLYVRINRDQSVNYVPFASSELEIDHTGMGKFGKYFVSNSSPASTIVGGIQTPLIVDNDDIYQLSLSTSGNSNTLTSGLIADVADGTKVIVRVLRNFDAIHLTNANPTRPSTALQFKTESDIYHLTSYNDVTLTIIATSVNSDGTINVTPGSTVGLKAGQQVKFAGTTLGGGNTSAFSSNILIGTTYFIATVTNSTIKISTSYANATLTPTPVTITPTISATATISTTAFANNEITLTAAFTGFKGGSILIASNFTGTSITGIIAGNTYYLSDDFTGVTKIKVSRSYEDAIAVPPIVLTIGGTPATNRTIVYSRYRLTGTIGGGTTKDLASTVAIDSNYSYITLSPKSGAVGEQSIDILNIGINDRTRILGMIFAWGDRIHKITNFVYKDANTDTITFSNLNGGTGLSKATAPSNYLNIAPSIKAGLDNKTLDNKQIGLTLVSEISVMRASSHDLVDIGTGGFANSNIPTNIYGVSAIAKDQTKEVQEIGRGRVFYSTTDQDGNFRVGKYFLVDQGTGSVSFAASIAISSIDGIGFSRGGVTVKEFATDDNMTNISNDTVPTQSAVVGYINKRLGLVYPGNTISGQKLGPGFMAQDGSTPFGTTSLDTLNMNSHRIINLLSPASDSDATPKSYVDSFFKREGSIRSNINGFVMSDKTQFTIQTLARDINNVATVVLQDNAIRSGSHGLSVGTPFTISNANTPNDGYNGSYVVKAVINSTTFTYDNAGVSRDPTPPDNVSASLTTESNISMNGAKITNLSTPTDVADAVTKAYVDAAVAAKDQLSELTDVAVSTILDGQPLSYNTATSKWVNNRSIDQSKLSLRSARVFAAKPSGTTITAGSFIVGKTYIIVSLGTTTQLQWNDIAGTTSITYAVGSIFVAATTGANSGNGTASEDLQANSGLASFNNAQFTTDSGFISLATNGIALSNLATIGTGFVIGNNSGVNATPALITFANALNSAITIPAGQGLTAAPAGVIAKGSDASFSTVAYSIANTPTSSTLVQRNATGGISVTSVSATGELGGGSVSVTDAISGGNITSSGTISAKTSLQIDTKKIFDYNGTTTNMYNQDGGKVAEFAGTIAAPTGTLYGNWTVNTRIITTGAAATTGTITGDWSLGTGSKLQSTYADLAEYYTSDNDYSPGTVVMIGGDQDVTLAKGYGNTAVAGVVSENPAYIMNSGCEGIRVAVALQGRVPCKVVGTIKKGDLLVVSQVSGAATTNKDPKPGSIIGKALSNYDSDRIGMIEVLVGKH